MFLFFLPYSATLNTDEKCKTYFTYHLGLDKKQITFKIIYKKLCEFILCIVLKKDKWSCRNQTCIGTNEIQYHSLSFFLRCLCLELSTFCFVISAVLCKLLLLKKMFVIKNFWLTSRGFGRRNSSCYCKC